MDRLNHLASAGEIDQAAPVRAQVMADIAAPPVKVWALLVNASAWPNWDEDIAKVSVSEPLAEHTRFGWSTGSNTVQSQVQLFEPERRLAWTGTALTVKAVHLWELTPEPGGHTLVTIQESLDGPLLAKLYSSQQLAEANQAWLASLKKAAEKH